MIGTIDVSKKSKGLRIIDNLSEKGVDEEEKRMTPEREGYFIFWSTLGLLECQNNMILTDRVQLIQSSSRTAI